GRRRSGAAGGAEGWRGLAEARRARGSMTEARDAFEKAAAIGRARGSAAVLTRAALGYAPPMSLAEQPAPDARVVAFLEQAIAAWRGEETALHVRALARLRLARVFGDGGPRREALAAAGAVAPRPEDPAALP